MAFRQLLIISCLITLCLAQDRASLDDLIKNIFDTTGGDKNDNVNGSSPPPPTPTKTTVLGPPENPNRNSNGGGKYKSCGSNKECVPRFLCKDNAIETGGIGLIDIRIGGEDCDYLETCCEIPNQTKESVVPILPAEPHEGCGYRNPSGVGFKITGDESNESQFGEFPWMVAILREEAGAGEILNVYECGGAIVAPNAIITAAHCVQTRQANTLLARAGEWDTQTKQEILPHVDIRVKNIIVHEKYNKGALYNDIALLILEQPFNWAENIRPICLPESNANFDSSRCYATGWGKDKFGRDGNYQVILKKIDLPIVPNAKCQENLRSTRLGKYFNLHDSFICAGGEKDKDTCKGDGGSPLVCPIPGVKDRYYHAGIVAWGIGCGEENIPGVYASVPYLRQWINEKLALYNINPIHYTAQ